MTTKIELIVNEVVGVVTAMRAEAANEHSINFYVASTLVEQVDSKSVGEFLNKLNTRLESKYVAKELREVYKAQTNDSPNAQIQVLRSTQQTLNKRVGDGEVLDANSEQAINMLNKHFTQYEQALKNGTDRTEAEIALLNALGVNENRFAINSSNNGNVAIPTFTGVENSWLQPKYLATASTLIGAGISIYTGAGLNYKTVGAAAVGAAVSYFGTDYLFDNVDFLKKLNPLLANVVAATLGMGLGVVATKSVAFYDNWNRDAFESQADVATATAIPAASAELTAWM